MHVRITQLESLESAARVILRVAPRIRHEYSRAHIEAELLMGGGADAHWKAWFANETNIDEMIAIAKVSER